MPKTLEADQESLQFGLEIIQEISSFRPYSSISFPLTERILDSLKEISRTVDWGMAKNKHKMKATVVEILEKLARGSPGEPANLNLTKYERKSFKAAGKLLKRILNGEKEGISLN